MNALRVHRQGAPSVMSYEDILLEPLGPGEVRVRNKAIGVNFVDVYLRNGTFSPPALPFTPGKEAAGEVLEVGPGVTEFAIGDRVAFVETLGAYAEESIVPARLLVPLPETIDFDAAAAVMLKGLTAQFLLRRTFKVAAGHTVLVHAAAGGVGTVLTQWAKHLGATVIGTAGSPSKAEIALQNGCDHVIDYRNEDFAARVLEITDGQRCHVVYDGVGQATFDGSLDCLRPFGCYVSFGWASGPIPPVDLMCLLEKGSLFVTSPGLTIHLDKREDLLRASHELFDLITNGVVKINSPIQLPLIDAAEAQRRLEGRETTGALVLVP